MTGNIPTPEALPLRPPYDPALQPILNILDPKIFESLESLRKVSSAYSAETILTLCPDLKHEEHTAAGTDGAVPLAVFTRKSSSNKSRPAVYVVHGGGQISGNRFSALDNTIHFFEGIDIVTISVEYRLAPEFPAPAALNDSYAGFVWVVNHAKELGIDPAKIIILGVSGGAPIAAGCAMLVTRNQDTKLLGQMLLTPMLDDRPHHASAKQFANTGPWCGKVNQMAWDFVLGKDRTEDQEVSELVVPARATDLTGLPPTFLDVGEAEVFRDEAVAYASALWRFGVSAELHVWKGGFHVFDMDVPGNKMAAVAIASVAAKKSWIRRLLELDS
ncbi:hypothetical protein N7517_010030 [Penicillium concentricum]|uniref:Alpha/beta hydrolase fold-3 domain-containing protein n=1 Tax=Penicillium concentricum TaxID=293559 RepID=A0A9W9RKB4_9EURO|nr:uncharacterized protein N7517_010030 [Penicillium concentricum]KAJ5360839.1 hypothetical protein N7517_010030 [Penicillium concentricum]